jgi:hypothetical protein
MHVSHSYSKIMRLLGEDNEGIVVFLSHCIKCPFYQHGISLSLLVSIT